MDIHSVYRPSRVRVTNRGRFVIGAVGFLGLWHAAAVLPHWMRWFV